MCDLITKNGAEKPLIGQLTKLVMENAKLKSKIVASDETVVKQKTKLELAKKHLKKLGALKEHFTTLINSGKKIESIFSALVCEGGDEVENAEIFDSNFPLIKVTKNQGERINLELARHHPEKNQKASQGRLTIAILTTLIGENLKSNYSDLEKSNPKELEFAISMSSKNFGDKYSLKIIQKALTSLKNYQVKKDQPQNPDEQPQNQDEAEQTENENENEDTVSD